MAAFGEKYLDFPANLSINDVVEHGNQADKQTKKKISNRRGGVKRRLSALVYHQKQYMMMYGGHPGGRPLHVSTSNTTSPVVPIRYPRLSGPRLFPPQKFGFFNEAAPSVHPGHPGSEKRTYEGPSKSRLIMEGRTRVPMSYPSLFASQAHGRGDVNGGPSMLQNAPNVEPREVGSKSSMMREQQPGMNELFAKMVWKKLDLIHSPTRLNRLHTEIMNLLQQAIAEETGK